MRIATIVQWLQDQPLETNRQGHPMHRGFRSSERYVVDFAEDFAELGWQQFDTDQDASYFGVWVNPKTYQVMTYAEGDWSLDECGSPGHYNREIRAMIDFYGEGCIAKAIDADGVTVYRQDRQQFFVEE